MARGRKAPRSSLFILAFLCAALGFAGAAGAAGAPVPTYAGDPGFIATSPSDFQAAKKSWETTEYGNFTGRVDTAPDPVTGRVPSITMPWQLTAVNASTAYALGYFGQGVTLGMMDSGYRASHEGFQSELIKSVQGTGVFGTSGFGYRPNSTDPNSKYPFSGNPSNPFTKGDAFDIRADFYLDTVPMVSENLGVSEPRAVWSHGTGMLGVSSGIRDGKVQHGISFGSTIYSGYTGGSDTQSHGAFHDYDYFYTANKALVDAGVKVINSSWGSYVKTLNRSRYDGLGNDLGINGNTNGYELTGRDASYPNNMVTVLPSDNLADLEYQYFFTKKTYSEGGIQYNPNHPGLSFMDAIWDAIKGTDVVNVRSAGNNDWRSPFYRPAYPLFNPWAEDQWVSVGGVRPPSADTGYAEYTKQENFNEAGLAKWWTVSTPSSSVLTTNAGGDTSYSPSSGTSPATPVASAVMGVLLSRYPDMSAVQVRNVMFTTANNKMTNGTDFLGTGQTAANGESLAWTAPDGTPDERWGWGIPDLGKGMYGPGQFLGPMTYNMQVSALDVWSNNISQVGIKAREAEDLKWLEDYKAQGIDLAGDFSPNVLNPDGTVKPNAFVTDGLLNDPAIEAITNGNPAMYDKIPYEDAVRWRKQWMDERAAYIQYKIDNGLYTASLTKQGPGTLVMTGDNTYEGGTTVEEGALYGFTESFGTGAVNVNGGAFGVLSKYNDLFTMKGELTSTQSRLANINVNNGGTFVIVGGENVNVGALNFEKGSKIQIGIAGTDILRDIYQDPTLTTSGTVATTALTGINNMVVDPDWAFFNMDVNVAPQSPGTSVSEGSAAVITGELSWNNAGLASYASNGNGRAVADVLSTNVPNSIMDSLLWSTKDQARNTLDSLGNDLYLTADTASIVNSLSLARTIKNQALGSNSRRSTAISETARVWATGVGNWSTVDLGGTDLDSEFYTGFLGIETDINPNHKIGLFAGAGWSEFDGGRNGKIESDDMHFGLYGVSNVADTVQLAYGGMYTRQEREGRRDLTIINATQKNQEDYNTDIGQLFLEAAYTGFNNERFSIEPYAGLNVLWLNSDSIKERIGAYDIKTGKNEQVVEAATIGLRGTLPLYATETGSFALRGDISGTAFMGDTRPEANLWIDNIGKAKLRGGRMDDPMLNVGLGFDAGFKSVKFGLAYEGAFNSDIQSNGVVANILINF